MILSMPKTIYNAASVTSDTHASGSVIHSNIIFPIIELNKSESADHNGFMMKSNRYLHLRDN